MFESPSPSVVRKMCRNNIYKIANTPVVRTSVAAPLPMHLCRCTSADRRIMFDSPMTITDAFKDQCYKYLDTHLATNQYTDENNWLYSYVFSSDESCWLNFERFKEGMSKIHTATKNPFEEDDIRFLFDQMHKTPRSVWGNLILSLRPVEHMFGRGHVSPEEFDAFFNNRWNRTRFEYVKYKFESLDTTGLSSFPKRPKRVRFEHEKTPSNNFDGVISPEELDNSKLFKKMDKVKYPRGGQVISFGEFKRYFIKETAECKTEQEFFGFVDETLNGTASTD